MSEYVNLFFTGIRMMFGNVSETIECKKTITTMKELRLAKAKMKKSVLQRSMDRITEIKREALN
tara:strand:+ start:8243 stop:8434 length:192 start_codon:yes stop_codon:yes gene_type:complete